MGSVARGVQAADLRRANLGAVAAALRTAPERTASEIAAEVGLSRPTVNSALSDLADAGLARVRGLRRGRAGQAPKVWEVHPDAGVVLGLDVGTRVVRMECVDLRGTSLGSSERPSHPDVPERMIKDIGRQTAELLAACGVDRDGLRQTVIGAPGSVGPLGDTLQFAQNVIGFQQPAFMAGLRDTFRGRAFIVRDVLLAALGEMSARGPDGLQDFALVTVGHGVGAALVEGGVPRSGWADFAGELAYLPTRMGRPDEPQVSPRGAFEEWAGVDAMLRRLDPDETHNNLRRLADLISAGDTRALAVLREEARAIAYAVAAILVVASPPAIVFTGSLPSMLGAPFVDAVADQLQCLVPILPATMELSAAGPGATVAGATSRALDQAWASALVRIA